MASIPVRLSAQLASAASEEAKFQDRSMTEQVEHWARLGQLVERAVSAATVARLKAQSYDPHLKDRIAFAETAEGRASAAAYIAEQNPVRYGLDDRGRVVKITGPLGNETREVVRDSKKKAANKPARAKAKRR